MNGRNGNSSPEDGRESVRQIGSSLFLSFGEDGDGCGVFVPPTLWAAALRDDERWDDEPPRDWLERLLWEIGTMSRRAWTLADGILAPLRRFWSADRIPDSEGNRDPSEYPDAIQKAALRLPALFAASARGDFFAFALALQSLDLLRYPAGEARAGFNAAVRNLAAACGDFGLWNRAEAPAWDAAVVAATDELLEIGMKAGIGESFRRRAIQEAAGLDLFSGGWSPDADRIRKLLREAVELGDAESMPAAESLDEWRILAEESPDISPKCRRDGIDEVLSRVWRFVGPLAQRSPSHDRPPAAAEFPPDDFASICRQGSVRALASLARAALGDDWPGDAYAPWRPALVPAGVGDVLAFAEETFRNAVLKGGAWGCFYLGQIAWKRTFDRFEAKRAQRDRPENRLLYHQSIRFLEVPCEEADRWFRRGVMLSSSGTRECERTLAWRTNALRSAAWLRGDPATLVADWFAP